MKTLIKRGVNMIRKKVISLIVTGLIITGALFTGCGNNKGAEASKNKETATTEESATKEIKDTIVYGLWSSPTGIFNPILSDTTYDNNVNGLIYSSLIDFDKDLNMIPGLADFKVSDDNLKITFTLKDNLKWHDGQDLTTKDIAFTIKSIADKDYEGGNYSSVEKIKGANEYHDGQATEIEGIKVIDDKTIEIELSEVYAPSLLNIGGLSIIPEHIWSQAPIATWKTNKELLENPVGSGPYKISEFKPDQHVKLEAFSDYYEGEPKTKNFIFKVTNQDTAQAELAQGTIDIADISTSKQKEIDNLKSEGLSVASYANPNFQYLGFNLREEKLQDKKVRQAFAYAIDRKLILEKLLEGNGVVLNAPMVVSGWAYPGDENLNTYDYNVEKSKELLKEAGYEDTDNDGILENAKGEDLKLTLKYPLGDKTREQCAPIIQDSLKQVGVAVELQNMEFKVLMDEVVGNHEFEMYLMMNTPGFDPDPTPYWHTSASSDEKGVYAWNMSAFRNEKADELMNKGLATLDINERKEIYKEFGILMNEELPWIPLYSQNVVSAYNSKLNNYEPNTYLGFYDVENWYIEK